MVYLAPTLLHPAIEIRAFCIELQYTNFSLELLTSLNLPTFKYSQHRHVFFSVLFQKSARAHLWYQRLVSAFLSSSCQIRLFHRVKALIMTESQSVSPPASATICCNRATLSAARRAQSRALMLSLVVHMPPLRKEPRWWRSKI